MKYYLKNHSINFILWNIAIFLLISFVVWELNPSQWDFMTRFAFCFLGPSMWFIVLLAVSISKAIDSIEKERNEAE